MRHWGYAEARCTAGGADGGIDIRSATALAQVKFEAAQVGAPTIQRLVGARGRDHHLELLFFSGAGYAAPAVEYANLMDVALFKYDLTGSMAALNAIAQRIVSRAAAGAVAGFPLAATEQWASQVDRKNRALRAASAGFVRRNWPILLAAYFVAQGLMIASGLITGNPKGHVWADLLIAVIVVPALLALRRWLGRRREALARQGVAVFDEPGPMPRAARAATLSVLAATSGSTASGKIEAVKALRSAVPGLELSTAKTLVDEISAGG
jgi:hypothetical protein